MNQPHEEEVIQFIENNIGIFHSKRIEKLNELKLLDILKRKNPYLFKAKNILTANDIVKGLLDAFLSSQEEGIFGKFFENLAIFICEKVHGGRKSSAEGIDLEFEKEGIRYIVSIKSGPNWGNSSQIKKLKDNFRNAKKRLGMNILRANIVAINGCCYGRDNNPNKGDYFKYCGQRFWEFISGNKNLYTELIEPLGHRAKEKNEHFFELYAQIVNKFTIEFINDFCDEGRINWEKLVKFNSSIKPSQKSKRKI